MIFKISLWKGFFCSIYILLWAWYIYIGQIFTVNKSAQRLLSLEIENLSNEWSVLTRIFLALHLTNPEAEIEF